MKGLVITYCTKQIIFITYCFKILPKWIV